jgi:hypothetical protein
MIFGGESEFGFPVQNDFPMLLGERRNFISGDHSMKRRRWTAQEIQKLQDRYQDEGPNQLAQEMGRSADSVSSFAHRCGLRTHRWLKRKEAPQNANGSGSAFSL